ncbi:MAG: enoyl-CoA hydratase/isomerase family protein [Acidimicrobiales bacterium]|nr:enoyl-CoA hydratase/isomerase family protein [Acidimicrobiales bacterium]
MELTEYQHRFEHAVLERRAGILESRLHSDGGPLQWGLGPHRELPDLFAAVASDYANRVVILTGTGNVFSGPVASSASTSSIPYRLPLAAADRILWEGKQLLMNLLSINAPVIAAVNGPAMRHCELALLSDIVLVAATAQFQDSAHFPSDMVPGDGMHVVFPLLLGANRGRAYLLTGKTISAEEALQLGLAFEIVPDAQLLQRARALATELASRSDLVLRYSRAMLTEQLKRQMQDLLGYGLALEMLALQDRPAPPAAGGR